MPSFGWYCTHTHTTNERVAETFGDRCSRAPAMPLRRRFSTRGGARVLARSSAPLALPSHPNPLSRRPIDRSMPARRAQPFPPLRRPVRRGGRGGWLGGGTSRAPLFLRRFFRWISAPENGRENGAPVRNAREEGAPPHGRLLGRPRRPRRIQNSKIRCFCCVFFVLFDFP